MNIKKFYEINEEIELPGMSGDVVDSWVNIKVDKDLPIRISRYAKALDSFVKNGNDLKGKLRILSNPTISRRYGPQCKLSIVILLQYLKEIKNNFESSSAGFLFEDYIAGLLHRKRHGGYKNYDFRGVDGTCQIKFYNTQKGQIKVNAELCDYYIVGLKNSNGANIWIIDNDGQFTIENYIVPYYYKDENGDFTDEVAYRMINATLLKKEMDSGIKQPYKLSFSNIDSIIVEVSKDIKKFVGELYDNISELNYNIETILTGVNKEQDIISSKEIEKYYSNSIKNIDNIESGVKNIKKDIFKKVEKY